MCGTCIGMADNSIVGVVLVLDVVVVGDVVGDVVAVAGADVVLS